MSKDMQVVNQTAPPAAPTGFGPTDAPAGRGLELGSHSTHEVDPNTELDDLQVRAWRAFLVGHAQVVRLLEADLIATSHLLLAEFDVLFQLGLAENHRLRMNELANMVVLSRAGMTRLIDRLVADGLVARLKCDSDARGAYAVLTERGHARLAEARPGHFAAVRRVFLTAFTRPELEALAGLMERSFPAE